ncbi:MAG: hypothetical protein ACJ77A_07030 [Actinomycetota bacterium]
MARRGIAVAAIVLGLFAGALPAHAAGTTTTFSLVAGSLSISAPASKSLGSGATGGGTVSAQLGTVTVTDGRGTLLGSWTSSVSSTDFTTGGATTDETIAKAAATYWSGPATASTGVGTFTPGQATSGNAQDLSASRTAFSASVLVGNNSASWNPTVTITVPASAVAGTYSGTITHSVA